MRHLETRPARIPGQYIVFIEFQNVQDCHTILQHCRNLPRDSRILTYIPPALRDRYKRLEEIAYELRHQPEPMKTLIRYSFDNLILQSRRNSSETWQTVRNDNIPERDISLISTQVPLLPPFVRLAGPRPLPPPTHALHMKPVASPSPTFHPAAPQPAVPQTYTANLTNQPYPVIPTYTPTNLPVTNQQTQFNSIPYSPPTQPVPQIFTNLDPGPPLHPQQEHQLYHPMQHCNQPMCT